MSFIKIGISFILIILVVSSCSPSKTKVELLAEAKVQIAENQFSRAEITLKNLIQVDVKMAEARYLLGDLYAKTNRSDSAVKEFLKAIEYSEDKETVTLALAVIYLEIGKNADVIKVLSDTHFKSESSLIYSYILKGKAYINLNKLEDAKDSFDTANDINAESSYSLYGSAISAAMDKNFQRGEEILKDVLDQHEGVAEAWILKAKFAERNNDLKEANSAYQSFLKLRPQAHSVKLKIAINYLKLNDIDSCEQIVDDFLSIYKYNPTANILKARVALERKNYSQVGEHAQFVLEVLPNNPSALYLAGLSYYFLQRFELAYDKLSKVTPVLANDHPAHRFLMLTMLKLGLIDELTNEISTFEGFYPNESQLIIDLATKLVTTEYADSTLKLLEKALEIQPNNVKAQTKIGLLQLLNNDPQGLENLKLASADKSGDNTANLALATAYLLKNEPEKANATIDSWLFSHPEDTKGLLLKVQVLKVLKKHQDALTLLHKIDGISPNHVKVLLTLAEQHFLLDDFLQAEQVLIRVLNLEEDSKEVYEWIFRTSIKLGKKTEFIEELRKTALAKPTLHWPRIILAQQSLIIRKAQESINWLVTIADDNNLPPDYYATALNSYFLLNDKKSINRESRRWQQLEANNLQSYSIQIDLLEKLNDIEQALKITRLARSQEALAESLLLMVLEVRFLLSLGESEEIDILVNPLLARLPNNAQVLQLAGIHALMQQHYAIAKNRLKASYVIDENAKTALLLAKAYRETDGDNHAALFLEPLAGQFPTSLAIQAFLSEIYMKISPDKALVSYKQLINKQPGNIVALNNLAILFIQNGDFSNAIKYAKQAQGVAPRHPEVLDTLGVALLKGEKNKAALEVLAKAYQIRASAAIKVHYAQALAVNEQHDQANSILTELTAKERKKFNREITQL